VNSVLDYHAFYISLTDTFWCHSTILVQCGAEQPPKGSLFECLVLHSRSAGTLHSLLNCSIPPERSEGGTDLLQPRGYRVGWKRWLEGYVHSPLSPLENDTKTIIAATATPIIGYRKTLTTLGWPRLYPDEAVIITGRNDTPATTIPKIIATIWCLFIIVLLTLGVSRWRDYLCKNQTSVIASRS